MQERMVLPDPTRQDLVELRHLMAVEKRRGLDRFGIEQLRVVLSGLDRRAFELPEGELVYRGFFFLGLYGPQYFSPPAKHAPETA